MYRKSVSIVVLGLLVAALLCGCTKVESPFSELTSPHHMHEMRYLEALMDSDPEAAFDSVRQLSQASVTDPWSALDANELLLREVQARYKCRALSDDSPDLKPVVRFYDSLVVIYPADQQLRFLRANAYYYKGVQCDDEVAAFAHFQKAFELANDSIEMNEQPKMQRFVALSCTRLGEVLFSCGLHEVAQSYFQLAFELFDKIDDRAAAAAVRRNQAAVFQALKQYEKAVAAFEEAEALCAVSASFAFHAQACLLFEHQQYDSALELLEQSFAQADPFAKTDAAAKLSEIYRLKGQVDKEIYYTRYFVESSLHESSLTPVRMEIEYLLKGQNQVDTRGEKGGRSFLWVALLIVVLVNVIGIMALVIVRNRKRISHIENKITTIERKHSEENADKDTRIELMARKLNDTREQLENVTKTTFEESWSKFSNSAIANKIRRSVEGKDIMIKSVGLYPKLKLKEVDVLELIRVANGSFADFSTRLLHDFPELTTSDLRHCCLALLGMNDAEIAVLEGISYSGSNRRSKKIVSVLDMDNSLEQSVLMYLRKYW